MADDNDRDIQRLSVSFTSDGYKTLERLKKTKGDTSLAETIRDAIAFENWYQEERQSGAKLLIQHRDGTVHEVVKP